ncbi:MAG: FHA domain-containing protein [Planctomycetes bacterium]|nr:FHA domain-containing protein [Planctomycetota bacterium]
MADLVWISGDNKGSSVPLERDATLLGRSDDCEVVIPGSDVSRRNSKIVRDEEEFFILDLESVNGTSVNKSKIDGKTKLAHGDVIKIGKFKLRFVSGDAPMRELTEENPAVSKDAPAEEKSKKKSKVEAEREKTPEPVKAPAPEIVPKSEARTPTSPVVPEKTVDPVEEKRRKAQEAQKAMLSAKELEALAKKKKREVPLTAGPANDRKVNLFTEDFSQRGNATRTMVYAIIAIIFIAVLAGTFFLVFTIFGGSDSGGTRYRPPAREESANF